MAVIPHSPAKQWIGIAVYMFIALAFSYFFRVDPPAWYEGTVLPAWAVPFKRLLGAFGVFLGAMVAERWFGTHRRITSTGTSPSRSWLMILFPVALFAALGVPNRQGLEPHWFGLLIGLQAALWVFLEEYGWRGYLQNELGHLRPLRRYLIIGALWYVWHLWFLDYPWIDAPLIALISLLVNFGILFGSSWGLGVVAERTGSILAAACFHMLGSFVQFNPIITENVAERTRWIIFAICLVVWVVVVVRWMRVKKIATNSALH